MDNKVGKYLWESKTVIFNVIMVLVLVAEQVPAIWANPPEWLSTAALLVGVVGNIILRVFFTDTPVVFSKG